VAQDPPPPPSSPRRYFAWRTGCDGARRAPHNPVQHTKRTGQDSRHGPQMLYDCCTTSKTKNAPCTSDGAVPTRARIHAPRASRACRLSRSDRPCAPRPRRAPAARAIGQAHLDGNLLVFGKAPPLEPPGARTCPAARSCAAHARAREVCLVPRGAGGVCPRARPGGRQQAGVGYGPTPGFNQTLCWAREYGNFKVG